MKLKFESQFDYWNDGEGIPSFFKPSIQGEVLIHAFVIGQKWSAGNVIEFYQDEKEFFLENFDSAEVWNHEKLESGQTIHRPKCFAVEKFHIKVSKIEKGHEEFDSDAERQFQFILKIGEFYFDTLELIKLIANNSGFGSASGFIEWLYLKAKQRKKEVLVGQLVHWTDQVYDLENAETL